MKNIINYYYNLNLIDIYDVGDKYFFNINNRNYVFLLFDRPIEDAPMVYNLYLILKERNIFVNDILTNKDNQIITIVNNIPYILIRDNTKNKSININDILYIQNNTVNIINNKKLFRNDWISMWCKKIDYYESQMGEISKKYPVINNTIDYYIGLGENAIEYLVYNTYKINNLCLSHKRIDINKGSFDFYNPSNFIIDSRVRDFSEYIKNLFFMDKINFEILKNYLDYINFTKDEYILFISRLLFPTFYFDQYDNIINYGNDENIIKNIISKTPYYIKFIRSIMIYIIYNKRVNIPVIEWIIKKID